MSFYEGSSSKVRDRQGHHSSKPDREQKYPAPDETIKAYCEIRIARPGVLRENCIERSLSIQTAKVLKKVLR